MVDIEEDIIREAVQGIWSAHDRVYIKAGEEFSVAHNRLASASRDFRETARNLSSHLHDALSLAEAQCRDMEERATNAEYNAKHYWRELQAEKNKSRMLDVQVGTPRKIHDMDDPADCECKEVWRVTYTNTALGLTGTSTGSASDGIGKG